MKSLLIKTLTKINQLRYPNLQADYRACITANNYSRLHELKFTVRDHVFRKKYKEISYYGEFQQELTFVIPFAYWHHQNGTLRKTVSCKDTRELYFFSENHEERYDKREWKGWNHSYDIPNMAHTKSFHRSKWSRVPFKEHYKNETFRFDKPILVVANKYNIEWRKSPINFLSEDLLRQIIEKYRHKYTIVYNRPMATHIVPDHSEILDLNEFSWIRNEYPEVLLMPDLYEKHANLVNNFNHLQLMVYANADRFISVHGGTAAFASCFGGTNIILSKEGFEHFFKEFDTIFPELSGANILVAKNEKEVLKHMDASF